MFGFILTPLHNNSYLITQRKNVLDLKHDLQFSRLEVNSSSQFDRKYPRVGCQMGKLLRARLRITIPVEFQ